MGIIRAVRVSVFLRKFLTSPVITGKPSDSDYDEKNDKRRGDPLKSKKIVFVLQVNTIVHTGLLRIDVLCNRKSTRHEPIQPQAIHIHHEQPIPLRVKKISTTPETASSIP
jgi:hypothetical protein